MIGGSTCAKTRTRMIHKDFQVPKLRCLPIVEDDCPRRG